MSNKRTIDWTTVEDKKIMGHWDLRILFVQYNVCFGKTSWSYFKKVFPPKTDTI